MIVTKTLPLMLALLLMPLAAVGQARYLAPDGGFASAVIVGGEPLAHTAQILPLTAEGEAASSEISEQLESALDNAATALKTAGSGLDKLVKVNLYADSQANLETAKDELRAKLEGVARPALSTLVTGFAVKDVHVALDVIAEARDAGGAAVRRHVVDGLYTSPTAHVAVHPAGGLAFIAGHPKEGTMRQGTRAALESLHAYLAHTGVDKSNVVQVKSFLQPVDQTPTAQVVVDAFYEDTPPTFVAIEWIANRPTEVALAAYAPTQTDEEALTIEQGPGRDPNPAQFSDIARMNNGRLVFFSGIYASEPGMEPAAEIRDVFGQLKTRVEEAGTSMTNLANVNYFLSSRETNSELSPIRPEYYAPDRAPAANRIGLPGVGKEGRTIMVDAVAVVPD